MEAGLTVLIFLAGLGAGFINVVAGGGSLITVPALILFGLPPTLANGTNRVAIFSQNAMAIYRFKNKGYFSLKAGVILGASAALGAIIGSQFAVEISGELFRKILSGIMVLVLILTLFGRGRRIEGDASPRQKAILVPVFFFIGIYGGFIQAGTGFLIIAALSIIGRTNLVRSNSIKVMVIFLYTIPSLIIFFANDQIAWLPGIILALGNTIGAWFGTRFSVEGGEKWIKIILTLAVTAMALRLFFFS